MAVEGPLCSFPAAQNQSRSSCCVNPWNWTRGVPVRQGHHPMCEWCCPLLSCLASKPCLFNYAFFPTIAWTLCPNLGWPCLLTPCPTQGCLQTTTLQSNTCLESPEVRQCIPRHRYQKCATTTAYHPLPLSMSPRSSQQVQLYFVICASCHV